MPKFKTREYLSEYNGLKDVIKTTYTNGAYVYHTMESPFVDLANSLGACKLNYVDNVFGFYLHLFNSKNEPVGVYKMTPRLHGFTQQQLADQSRRLFWCKRFNQHTNIWETYVDGRLVKADIYKEGRGLATILKDDKWSVIDRNHNYVVPPGKYDYIDGFDKCGLARVKIKGKTHLFDPEKSTRDRWGIIDTEGNEVLPLIYSEIWNFYNKGRNSTKVYKGEEEDGEYIVRFFEYRFEFDKRRLIDVEAEELERTRMANLEYNYSVWDALDGEPEAAGNIDYEWL